MRRAGGWVLDTGTEAGQGGGLQGEGPLAQHLHAVAGQVPDEGYDLGRFPVPRKS